MFSVLTSKIYGAATLALLAALVYVLVTRAAVIDNQKELLAENTKTIAALRQDVTTLRANSSRLELGLEQCNASSVAAAEAVSRVANAGARAVEQVREAGAASVAASLRRLESLPRDGATLAEQCAQADAILMQGAD